MKEDEKETLPVVDGQTEAILKVSPSDAALPIG